METDIPPSCCVPVTVKVSSELEPVECKGDFLRIDDGFILTFSIGENKFSVTVMGQTVVLKATGLLSYELNFAAAGDVVFSTPYGDMSYRFTPVNRTADVNGEGAQVSLVYVLEADGSRTERSVCVSARFL